MDANLPAAKEESRPPGWLHPESPLHKGELAVQARLGVQEKMDKAARRGVRDYMPEQHREFFAQLPFIAAAAVDADRQPWASLLVNPPGFITSPDERSLHIDAGIAWHDPLQPLLTSGTSIGLLGIEFHTRRRNRLNGVVTQATGAALDIRVTQSFGNCPKYIQARETSYVRSLVTAEGQIRRTTRLDGVACRLIAQADTFFIASAYFGLRDESAAPYGVDVSHRGGKPGFVQIDGDDTLTVPDFVGNFFFNTLGNLILHPAAGLLFVDFSNGEMLHVAVDAEIIWDGPEVDAFAGAQRLLRLHVKQALHVVHGLPLHWSAPELSPFVMRTGDWNVSA